MKELARKGNIAVAQTMFDDYRIVRYAKGKKVGELKVSKILAMFNLKSIAELSDLKACIDKVTAKKWGKHCDWYVCPDCKCMHDSDYHFCHNCGVMLEGVEE